MEKIELAFEHFSLPAKANRLIQDCKEASEEICARGSGEGDVPDFVPADGRTSWNLLNTVLQHRQTERELVFCEWGSGIGLVTLIASMIGMDATGIEIDEELNDLARQYAKQYSIPATFINASFYPAENPDPLIDYQNVDLFFAYPWPDQITRTLGLFNKVARSGAILVCYHGGRNYRVLRR